MVKKVLTEEGNSRNIFKYVFCFTNLYLSIYMIFTTEGFLEVAIES